jgi:pimeloyl-ACP methyl ester carboxylesterase
MKLAWLGCMPLGIGCAAASESLHRLTPFREEFFQAGALRDVQLDGHRYCILELGQGPPIVLLHGLGGSLYDWRHLIGPLATHHRVIAVDLLGSGESDLPEGEDYSIPAQARRIRSLFEELAIGPATLLGSSYGGGIALRFAQDWPERVDRLVLFNPACYAEHVPVYVYLARAPFAGCLAECFPLSKATRGLLGTGDGTLESLSDGELDAYTAELRRPGRRRTFIDTLRAILPPDSTEFEARLKRITAPALLIWGRRDPTVPLVLGHRLVRDLPDAQLYEVDAGHVPNQERPQEVLKLLEGFLR